ncbi:MAG: cysteine--tRNA ligase, partial [Planctomycetota bacterium]
TEQIDNVKKLIEKGFAYEINGSVYYDVTKFKDYGKLSGRNIEDMLAGARVEVSPDKKNPADFALWKKAEANHIMQWPSPWGMGYPGWHLECSVMSTKYLGQPFDIHGGGIENQFPHHDCEIAQAEAAEGNSFTNFWMHNNMVTVDGQKMGKSLNNFITLKEVFDKGHERLTRTYDSLAVRQLILNSHYRSPLDFSDAALTAAQSGFDKITTTVKTVREAISSASDGTVDSKISKQLDKLKQKFESAMNDDLNTSIALSILFDMTRLANKLLEENSNKSELSALDDLFNKLGGDCLGIVMDEYPQAEAVDQQLTGKLIEILIDQRNSARKNKDFATSDAIRDKLIDLGIELKDRTDGTDWSIR